MRKAIGLAVAAICVGSLACADSTGPGERPKGALHGTYAGKSAGADIILRIAFGVDTAEVERLCEAYGFPLLIALCLAHPDNLTGSGSITISGHPTTLILRGSQYTDVGMTLFPDNAPTAAIRLSGKASGDGRTLKGFIVPYPSLQAIPIFGDSASVTLVRQN